ncbi:MAG: thioredoxin-disulfide reductase [Patescibacteria group bacterium]
MSSKKVAIIGSGPAGCTAAIYASRADLEVDVYLGSQPGGQLTTTTVIENFPGFIEGIQGPELMQNMLKQAERFGAKSISGEVTGIEYNQQDKSKKRFTVKTLAGDTEYDAVIIGSGARAKYIGIPGEEKYVGNGYHSCATCDGFFYRGKTIAVVGGGDSAMEEAHFLTKFASKVYLIHRRDEFRASKIMQERALSNPKIEVLYNTQVTAMHGDPFVEKVTLQDTVTGETRELELDGVFVAIGHTPNTDFVKGKLSMDEAGYLRPVEGQMTEIPGLFTCGDVDDTKYRQAITAAGEGCKAAMDCEKWLEANSEEYEVPSHKETYMMGK